MKTPQQSYPELAAALGINELYLKREDQHKYGSHKGRSIPPMIKKYFKEDGQTDFVLSSSGNAALAAIQAIQAHNRNNPTKLKLTVFVGNRINPEKLKLLVNIIEDPNIKLEQVARPMQTAFLTDKHGQARIIRQATDDSALIGYEELAEELSKIPNSRAVFIPTSSGATAQALGIHFQKMKKDIQIHIAQTTACHPMVPVIARSEATKQSPSIADAIVDNIAHRKEKVVEIIKNSGGSGWIADDEEIKNAIKLVEETCNILISPNSALSIAGLKKAVENGWKFNGAVVCLITGR